ncbi:MAG: hypothetical protein ACI865_002418 [Flavobacteriaceae bacterium]|jgi:hypothetical protein
MVDGTRHYRSIIYCSHLRDWRWFCPWPIYLFFILMSKSTQKEWLQLLILSASISGLYFIFWQIALPIIGGSILIIGISPPMRRAFLIGFNSLMKFIAAVKTYLLIGITYFVLLTPIAAIRGVLKKKKNNEKTTFFERNHVFTPSDMDNMW